MRTIWNYIVIHIFPDIRLAVGQLVHHRLRTLLTLLGMIFGVGAVIAMLAVSEGGRIEAMSMIEGMGVRNLIVDDVVPADGSRREIREHSAGLSISDAHAIQETMPFVEMWAGIRRLWTWNLFSHEGESNAEVWAVSSRYFELSGLEPHLGKLFEEVDDVQFTQKAVLGDLAARELFPKGDPVGKRIKINYLWLEVIGVLKDRQLPGSDFQGEQVGGDGHRVYLPLHTGLKRIRLGNMDSQLSSLKIQVAVGTDLSAAASAIQHLLSRRHGGQLDTRMVIPARLLAQQRKTQRIFTIVMSAVASISLLVGGIGIMNIMLASVLERKSEIGLLRAVGARKVDVVRQFIVETAVIAIFGAIVGIVAGIAIAYTIAFLAQWAVAWSLLGIGVAVLVCVAIAVGFGVYPALSASRLDPVAALQAE